METMYCIGSGNSCLSKEYQEKLLVLNNKKLEFNEVKHFLEKNNIPKFPIELSNRKTKWALGICWPKQQRIRLYRHSVGIFLHETAHLVNYANFVKKKQNIKYKPHGKEFAQVLESLIDMWYNL